MTIELWDSLYNKITLVSPEAARQWKAQYGMPFLGNAPGGHDHLWDIQSYETGDICVTSTTTKTTYLYDAETKKWVK